MVLALFLGLGLVLAIPLGSDFWADSQATPLTTEGRVTRVYTPHLRSSLGAFDLRTEANHQAYRFEISPRLLDAITSGASLKVTHSPNMLHVYSIEFKSSSSKLYQDRFDPGRAYQQWQSPIVWLVAGMIVGSLGALAYSLLALSDWLRTARRVRGALVARIEQADNSAAGFALVLRTAARPKKRQREPSRFRVSQPDFLLTDQADYIELEYSPVFKYVRKLKVLRAEDFPPGEAPALQEGGVNRLRYRPGWYLRMLLFTDFIFAAFLFAFASLVFITRLSQWFDSGLESQLYERYILPGLALGALALGAFVIALFLMSSFLRKLGDLRAPKKLTIGPVLSKWRVTGVTNDMRRQIVVADGGLQAGGEGVRKFDINSFLYDEIRVGDIVEIEHSPRLRYIFRLEVTGHQELPKSF